MLPTKCASFSQKVAKRFMRIRGVKSELEPEQSVTTYFSWAVAGVGGSLIMETLPITHGKPANSQTNSGSEMGDPEFESPLREAPGATIEAGPSPQKSALAVNAT